MALALKLKDNFSILIILSISMFCLCSEAAEGDLQGQNLVKALSCFNNKLVSGKYLMAFVRTIIYVGCDEAYRLNPSGNINIPVEATDLFCSGACLTEAQLVLNCIDDILSNFIFYNKATVQQMRYALNAGCSFSRQRGNFNLAAYIGGETNNAPKLPILRRSYLFILAAAAAVYLI